MPSRNPSSKDAAEEPELQGHRNNTRGCAPPTEAEEQWYRSAGAHQQGVDTDGWNLARSEAPHEVWMNFARAQLLLPIITRIYTFQEGVEQKHAGADARVLPRTSDNLVPICQYCFKLNLEQKVFCKGCGRVDATDDRFTRGDPEAEPESDDSSCGEPVAPGSTVETFEHKAVPTEDNDTAPHSKLDLATLIHWRDGTCNTDANSRVFRDATKHFTPRQWDGMQSKQH